MNSLEWSLFFLFSEFNPLACLDQSRKLRGLDCISELTTINFWTVFHRDAHCHLGWHQAKPAQLSDQLQMEMEVVLPSSLRPCWPFIAFRVLPQLFFPSPTLRPCMASHLSHHLCSTRVTIAALQELFCLRGHGNLSAGHAAAEYLAAAQWVRY